MKLASVSDRIHAAGGEVIALSVDSDERNAAMFARWPTPHIRYVSDPVGERLLQPLGLFDPDERGGIALPGLVLVDPSGKEPFRYEGRDFADRTHDEDVFDALEGLGLDAIEAPAGGPVDDDVDVAQKGAFRTELFGPYFLGNKFGALAIRGRAEGDEARALAKEHSQMADGMLEAWKQVQSG